MPVLASRGARAATALGLAGDGFPPAALALFARMSPTPSPARKVLISQTIAALTIAGVWQKLDMLQVYAADAQANALLNWISSSYNASVVNSPTFTADRGFTSVSGTSSYVASGYTPSSGPKWGQNDHTFGRWMRTGPGGAGMDFGAYETATLKSATIRSDAGGNYAVGDSGTEQSVFANSIGSVVGVRSASGSFDIYKNGAFVTNVSAVSRVGTTLEMFVGAYNLDGVAGTYSPNQIGAVWAGQALNSTEIAALHTALQNYMTGVGA